MYLKVLRGILKQNNLNFIPKNKEFIVPRRKQLSYLIHCSEMKLHYLMSISVHSRHDMINHKTLLGFSGNQQTLHFNQN